MKTSASCAAQNLNLHLKQRKRPPAVGRLLALSVWLLAVGALAQTSSWYNVTTNYTDYYVGETNGQRTWHNWYTSCINVAQGEYIGYNSGSYGSLLLSRSTNQVGWFVMIGYIGGSTGDMTLSAGSLLVISNTGGDGMSVGNMGRGTLLATGATLNIGGRQYVGQSEGSAGQLSLAASTETISDPIYVGYYAGSTGTITLTSGSLLETTNYSSLSIGSAGRGLVIVSNSMVRLGGGVVAGGGSNSYGRMDFYASTGILSSAFQIGASGAGTGMVTVAGNSLLSITGAAVYVGNSAGRGFLVVTNSALVCMDVEVGFNSRSHGQVSLYASTGTVQSGGYIGYGGGGTAVIVLAQGSRLEGPGTYYIGKDGGQGNVFVSNSLFNTGGKIFVSYGVSSSGRLDLNAGTNIIGAELNVAAGGTGVVNLANGSRLETTNSGWYTYIGNSGQGTVWISNSALISAGVTYVGNSSNGVGTIRLNAGTNLVRSTLMMGNSAASTGIYNLAAGSTLIVTGGVNYLGYYGYGSISASNSQVFAYGGQYMAQAAGSYGEVQLSASTSTVGGALYMGSAAGSTAKYILSNSCLRLINGAQALIGYGGDGTITALNSVVEFAGAQYIGYTSQGKLLLNGSTATYGNSSVVGYSAGCTGIVNVAAGGQWVQTNGSTTYIGYNGGGGAGLVDAQGAGTYVKVGALNVGSLGRLTVRDGATFSAGLIATNAGQVTFSNNVSATFSNGVAMGNGAGFFAPSGTVTVVNGNYACQITNPANYGANTMTLRFTGSGVHTMLVAGANLGQSLAGYSNSFALGRLYLGSPALLTVEGAPGVGSPALYVTWLDLDGSAGRVTNLSSALNVYYRSDHPSNSYLQSQTYNLSGGGQLLPVPASSQAAAPTYNPNGGTFTNSVSVTLSSTTPGSTIYYATNGTAPTTNSPSIPSGNSIALVQPYSNNVRAFARAAGYTDSAISTSALFRVVAYPPAAAPTYNPNGGTFTNSVSVTLSSTTPGSTIYYSTNGTAPTTNSPSVPSGNSVGLFQPYSNNVRAFARAAGYTDSAISTSTLFRVVASSQAAAPTYNPNGGTFTNSVSVALSSTTPGSTIYYATNGTAPTTNSPSVPSGNSIGLFQPYSNNVRAFARAAGYADSAISTSALFRVVAFSYPAPTGTWEVVRYGNEQYGFEPNKEGWGTWGGVTNTSHSTNWADTGYRSLKIDCNLTAGQDTGESSVDMRYYPPLSRTPIPVDLNSATVTVRVLCPAGSSGTNSQLWAHHQLKLFAKDENWNSIYATNYLSIPFGTTTQTLSLVVVTNAGFNPRKIISIGINVYRHSMGGNYQGPIYADTVMFPGDPPPAITNNTQHLYDMEANSQQAWWKWGANPEGWHAKAWNSVYYGTNWGVNGSVALGANAAFQLGVDEVVTNNGVVTTNYDVLRKGVFEIGYQPALNLSTKDHRRIQARLGFYPAVEGLLNFEVSINVYDKITDQWYFKKFGAGGAGYNTFDFDLDNPLDYATNSPAGPMNTEAIGFVAIQVYANAAWTGAVFIDDLVVGGKETGTNYVKLAGAFVKPNGTKFIVGGTNFYFCGANIEYLQTEPDAIVRQCLDWASSNHLQVIRTWAMQEGKPYSFQPQRGVWNELMFEHLDRIVAEAGHRNIRLMLGLCDNWAHNGGIFQYVHWATREHPESVNTNLNKEGVEYHDQFWTNQWCRQWYRDYVTKLLNRTNTITGVVYKNDPTVFAWEIVNEPRCESDFGGGKIHTWLHDQSDWVRTIDANHILGNGEEGGYVNTYDFADTIPWEDYPINYYHYGVYGTGSSTCDLYGCGRGHGVDFLSDNNTLATFVQWQDGFYTNQQPTNSEWRAGNSNINFCTARIYVDQKEYNVWRTNQNGADQRFEWINDHWYDAHETIGKPMILEEFGIHAIGWIFNGSYGQVQLTRTPEYTLQDRVNIYSQYYGHIENSGISGSFFWNFGFQGMWEDFFHAGEQVAPWYAETGSGCATSIVLSGEHVVQGTNALKMSWYGTNGANQALFKCPTNETWVLRVDNSLTNDPPTRGINRTKFFWSFYNPNAYTLKVSLAVVGGPDLTWCEGAASALTAGWNRVLFDLSAGHYVWVSNGVTRTNYLINIPSPASNVLEDVRQVALVFKDLPAGHGDVFVDNVKIKRDDGFVIYADDPVNPVIKAHADRLAARNIPTNRANAAPVASNLWIVAKPNGDTTAFTLVASDANGDPLSYRIKTKPQHGWVFGTPPNMVYKPQLGWNGEDSFSYVAYDGLADSAEAVVTVTRTSFDNMRYSFETGLEGWYANYQSWAGYGITGVVRTTERSLHSNSSLKAWVKIFGSNLYDRGDAEVNMEYDPPAGLQGPVNLDGQPLQVSLYCPTGSRGSTSNPNKVQVYAKDAQWLAQWAGESDIVENSWMTLTLTVLTNGGPGVWTDTGFNPQKIRAIGARIKRGGAGSDYTGPIYIDAATFPVMGRNLYSFRTNTESWTSEDWSFGMPTIQWTNGLGNPTGGALWVTPSNGAGYGKFYVKDWDLVENENLLYRPILQTYVWAPCDAPSNPHHAVRVKIYVRSSSDNWVYTHVSPEFVLTPCQWNLLSWDLSGLPTAVLTDVDEVGLEIVWANRDIWEGGVGIDSINVLPKGPVAAPSISSITPATNSVGRYQKYEVAVGLNNVQGLNPFDPHMVDLNATFTSPSGTACKVNGFYMESPGDTPGNGTWRIRFAPNQAGSWSYRVTVGNHLGASTSSVQNFTCVAGDRHGWIRVSDNDAHYFEHADDTPFFGRGYCHAWDGDDEGLFANCEEHGINMIHWWSAPWDTLLTVKPADPTESWRERSSFDTYEQNRAAEVDRVLGHAERHNVKLAFTIWPHDAIRDFNFHKWRLNGSWAKAFGTKFSEPEWYVNAFSELDDPPKNQKFFYDSTYREYQDRLYRYIIARWGYSEAIGVWALVSEMFGTFANSANGIRYQDPLYVTNKSALFGENPYLNMDTNQCDGNDYTIPWLTYINSYFKTNDPFGHPTTASYATDEYWDQGFPIVDVPQIHAYADLYNWITPPVTVSKYHRTLRQAYNKPAFLGEIGTVEWKTFEPDYTRVVNWPAVCSGAAIGPMMWTTPAFSWFGDAKMGPWYDPMSDEMKVLSKFVADIPFHKLWLQTASASTTVSNETAVTLVESFEGGMNSWALWGPGITNSSITTNHATHGTNSLRLNVNMETYALMP
ncbi:MAG: chitobiase/beta-hexosaminidase C-terminal domain-containing protein, partial [Verrucomicrobiota bacterium]